MLAGVLLITLAHAAGPHVTAAAETAPLTPPERTGPASTPSPAAVDPAVWLSPRDPAQSLVLGAFASPQGGGLGVFDLGGGQVRFFPSGPLSGVDVRRVPAPRGKALIAACEPEAAGGAVVRLFTIDEKSAAITPAETPIKITIASPGPVCVARVGDRLHVLVGGRGGGGGGGGGGAEQGGAIEQWRLDELSPAITATPLGTIPVAGGPVVALAFDAAAGRLYVATPRGLRRLDPARPESAEPVGAAGEGLPGVSGIAIVGEWILATLPADSTLAMIRRDAPRDVAARLTIADSPSVDGCTGLAGLDASGEAMGARFPRGVVVVQDDDNAGSPPNFKLVPWEACLREATRRP